MDDGFDLCGRIFLGDLAGEGVVGLVAINVDSCICNDSTRCLGFHFAVRV